MTQNNLTPGQTVVFKRDGKNFYGRIVVNTLSLDSYLVEIFNYPPPFPVEWINKELLSVVGEVDTPSSNPVKLTLWGRIKAIFN